MTNKTEKNTGNGAHHDVAQASKNLVSQSKVWATTMREAMVQPFMGATDGNELASMMFTPWLSMGRMAHDRMLEMYENQAHEMIDRSYGMLEQMQKFQQIQQSK